jgi:hypothetical protein
MTWPAAECTSTTIQIGPGAVAVGGTARAVTTIDPVGATLVAVGDGVLAGPRVGDGAGAGVPVAEPEETADLEMRKDEVTGTVMLGVEMVAETPTRVPFRARDG